MTSRPPKWRFAREEEKEDNSSSQHLPHQPLPHQNTPQKYLSKRFVSTQNRTHSEIKDRSHYKAFRIYLLGAASSGKTTFMRRITKNEVPPHDIPTIGVDYSQIHLDNYEISLDIYEFGGNPHFRDIYSTYFQMPFDIALIFVDISRRDTLEDYFLWRDELRREHPYDDLRKQIIVVGSKRELRPELTQQDLNLFTKHEYPYFEISAKKKRGIRALLQEIETRALDHHYKGRVKPVKSQFAERFRSVAQLSNAQPEPQPIQRRRRRTFLQKLLACSCCVP